MRKWLLPFIAALLALSAVCRTQDDSICLPLHHLKINSAYGWRYHPLTGRLQFHKGIDLAARADTVFCVLPGTVARVGSDALTGNYIIIDHGGALQTLYGHLSGIAALPGDTVSAGSVLGITGSSGFVTGEHLHFAVRYGCRDIPPLRFLCGLFRPP